MSQFSMKVATRGADLHVKGPKFELVRALMGIHKAGEFTKDWLNTLVSIVLPRKS